MKARKHNNFWPFWVFLETWEFSPLFVLLNKVYGADCSYYRCILGLFMICQLDPRRVKISYFWNLLLIWFWLLLYSLAWECILESSDVIAPDSFASSHSHEGDCGKVVVLLKECVNCEL
ncbi:hypothetical protein DM860_015594 [Cuscuta australis]|uniref:Uncharacterized protein n=1 Tax=Cuscuta australis TaxID=267555 RepID=A0A328DFD8_9ASTE|nr:hypothetical protein DM860_015594 [Cuscuta australis]